MISSNLFRPSQLFVPSHPIFQLKNMLQNLLPILRKVKCRGNQRLENVFGIAGEVAIVSPLSSCRELNLVEEIFLFFCSGNQKIFLLRMQDKLYFLRILNTLFSISGDLGLRKIFTANPGITSTW